MSRVLVVEDEPDLLDLMAEILEDAGHEVLRASTGEEGWRLFVGAHPHVVLLDLTLPDVDGWAVLDRAREDPATATVPVVIVSGNAFPSELARARHSGVVEFVAKPFSPTRLVDVVARFGDRRRCRSSAPS